MDSDAEGMKSMKSKKSKHNKSNPMDSDAEGTKSTTPKKSKHKKSIPMDSEAEGTKSTTPKKAKHKKSNPIEPEAEDTKSITPKKAKDKKSKKKTDHSEQPLQVTVEVEVVKEQEDKIAPLVGYFPSGFDPLRSYGDDSAPTGFQLYRNMGRTKRLELVVSPPGAPVDFVGTNYTGEATTKLMPNYRLGVFDKETRTLKIVPIAGNKIFRLDPKVKAMEVADLEPETSTIGELSPQEKAVKERQTTHIFGTKKDIEKARKRLALNQDDNAEAQRNLDAKMKNVVANKSALESTASHVARNIPPYDLSATTPQEAYVLDQIILKGEWDYLEDIYYFLEREEADFSAYPAFVRNRIEKLKKIQDESEKKKLCCIFAFINHLIKFKDQHSIEHSSAKSHRIPNILRHRFSAMFSVDESKRLPPEKIKFLHSYVLVLTLFADGFQTGYDDISHDLRTDKSRVKDLYYHLGCKIVTRDKKPHATLPVPLKFPELRLGKRKRN